MASSASSASVVTVPLGAAADLVAQAQTTTELTGVPGRSAALTLPASRCSAGRDPLAVIGLLVQDATGG
jgi:hypothetical protein